MYIFLRDAVGPDERGEPPHITFEHTLMNGEVQVLSAQDYWVLVVIIDNGANW